MNKEEINQLESNAEQNSEWLEKARETIAGEKGKNLDSDTQELDEQTFQQYIEQHSKENDYEYLVRGAKLCCRCGSHIRMLNLPECHGVYIEENPMVHEYDCIQGINRQGNISWFGICTADRSQELPGDNVCYELTKENNKDGVEGQTEPGKKCQPIIVGVWQDVYDKTKIVDKWEGNIEGEEELCSLTTGSFLVCAYGGIIEPLTSGQEYIMSEGDLGLDEDGKSVNGNVTNENVWDEIEKRRKEGGAECGNVECSLAHERYFDGDETDHGSVHGTNFFTVVFQYEDGEIIEKQEVKRGESAVAPTNLKTRVDYIFWGWDQSFDKIDKDIIVKATGVYRIQDERNPQGIPLYSGKTMDCEATYHTFDNHIEALYDNVKITFDSTRIEGSNYKYIHPQRYKEDVDVSGTGYNAQYHGTYCSNGNYFSLADNRMEIAVRKGISCVNGDAFGAALAGEYIDIVLSDGTVLACILGASKGNEDGSSADGLVHHDGSIVELLVAGTRDETYPYGKVNADKYDILHGQDMVGFYTYPSLRLYNSKEQQYHYYFSEGED